MLLLLLLLLFFFVFFKESIDLFRIWRIVSDFDQFSIKILSSSFFFFLIKSSFNFQWKLFKIYSMISMMMVMMVVVLFDHRVALHQNWSIRDLRWSNHDFLSFSTLFLDTNIENWFIIKIDCKLSVRKKNENNCEIVWCLFFFFPYSMTIIFLVWWWRTRKKK